ncbi:hypothetical protein OAX78_03075 [Planctomycetota bacterium]|nr:hypothetical protein [Planctomycetota bacterium]
MTLTAPERGPIRIGVVGFSRKHFDQATATRELRSILQELLATLLEPHPDVEIVSGLTNQGVPRIAYQLARELNLKTVGVSARRALRVRAGVYPVDERIIQGEEFGDESEAFVNMVDLLIRIGGRPQSRHEVDLFRARHGNDAGARLVESEVAWF